MIVYQLQVINRVRSGLQIKNNTITNKNVLI